MRNSSSLDWLRFMHTPNDYRVSRHLYIYVYLSVLSIKQIGDMFCLLTNMFLCMVGGTNKGSAFYDVESFL